MKKFWILICFICLEFVVFPFVSMIMVLLLSWYNVLDIMVYCWCSKKVHNIWGIASSRPISSASVMAPPLKVTMAPVWPQQSSWIAQDALTYHFMTPTLLAVKVKHRFFVLFKHFNTCLCFLQSSSSGSCIHKVRNATGFWISRLALLLMNESLATWWWNSIVCSSGKCRWLGDELTSKRYSAAGVIDVRMISSGKSLTIVGMTPLALAIFRLLGINYCNPILFYDWDTFLHIQVSTINGAYCNARVVIF